MNLIDVSNIVELLRLIKDGADYSVTVGTDSMNQPWPTKPPR